MNAVSIPGSEELEVLSPSCIEIVQSRPRPRERMPAAESHPASVMYKPLGLIHYPWLNPDQRLKGNLHEQANADRNDRVDVSPNWRVGEKLVWLEG
ncbi:hypothetical protein AVEN_80092-1 [Araneus ventricosus]|uniref:Uncharacterized protein n=1 Tax=Araneus ventricosus TaxID=182803 RepID=A0A4Y2SLF5_ARAVE|nr:hypothetical protein AVEN_80092-1 [Araneus ventricosus]